MTSDARTFELQIGPPGVSSPILMRSGMLGAAAMFLGYMALMGGIWGTLLGVGAAYFVARAIHVISRAAVAEILVCDRTSLHISKRLWFWKTRRSFAIADVPDAAVEHLSDLAEEHEMAPLFALHFTGQGIDLRVLVGHPRDSLTAIRDRWVEWKKRDP